jgi:hypothetical protein
MEVKMGNRRLKLIDGKVHIVKFSGLGIEIKSGKFTPIKFTKKNDGYNQCKISIDGRPTMLREHRLVWKMAHPDWDIWDSSPDNMIDHYNRKRDDNRLENLHVVNQQQNQWNRDGKGYCWNKSCKKWQAYIKLNNKKIHLGMFEKEEDAHNAYLEAKPKHHVIAAPLIPGHAAPTD